MNNLTTMIGFLKHFSFLLFILVGISFTASASHYSGGEITYAYNGPNQYIVTLKVYRDCNGVTVGSTQVVNYSSASCGVSSSITLNLQSTTDITPLCPTEPSACGGSGSIGIELLVFQGVLNLPPGCSDWVLWTSACCRNSMITNLSGASSQSIYIEAHLDNTVTPGNNSPEFSSAPQFFGCVGQTINFQQLAYDIDGDSLVYSLVNALVGSGTSVTYAGGFSGVNPFTVPLVLDPQTGQITFTPNVPQVAVVAVLIEEYRGGVLIGSIMRDIQFIIQPCTNTIPTITGMNGTTSFDTTICEGANLCFNIFASDVDAGQNVTLTYDNAIPGAIFTLGGTATNPTGTFCWSTSLGDQGTHAFTVTAEDDACPLIGQNGAVYTINVVANPNPPVYAGMDVAICEGDTTFLNATTGAPPATVAGIVWTPTTGLSTPMNASTNASPISTTSYTATLTYTDGCISQDAVTVTVLDEPVADVFPGMADVCGGANFLLTGTTNQTGMSFEWFDPAPISLGSGTVAGSQSTLSVTVPTAAGTYPYVLVVTNPLTGCFSTDTVYLTVGTPPALPSCVNIYVSPTAAAGAAGTQADPATLQDAMAMAACNNAVLKLAIGTYNIDNALTLGSFATIEGGFDPGNAWTKTSLPGATTINRTTANPEGPINAQRLVAFYGNGTIGFRLQDVTISTANANLSGMSTYAVHLSACSDYNIVRCQLLPGDAAAGQVGTPGTPGANGANGANGQNGSNDNQTGGGGGGNGGAGGGGIAGGAGGACCTLTANGGAAGTAPAGINGGSGAGGGSGGGEDRDGAWGGNGGGGGGGGGAPGQESGCNSSVNCGSSESGNDAANGNNGTNGAWGVAGPVGSHIGGFWVPGGMGGTGTNGTGGAGGGGGGGGAGEGGFFCIDGHGSGGGGGGGGGQAGTGGFGGLGGGSSYALYLFTNGTNGNVIDCNVNAGTQGPGGAGGAGGAGGNGGFGGNGSTYTGSEVGCGGDGGNGGLGGNGGNGGSGQPGQTIDAYLASGSALATSITSFNLAAQPVITVSNINCTNTTVQYDDLSASGATWDFDVVTNNAVPATGVVSPGFTQYTAIDRYTVSLGFNTYTGFHNIAFDNTIGSEIATNAPPIGVDTFLLCVGDYANFESVYYADVYTWDFDGAIPNPGNIQVVSSQFNTPGFFTITMNMTTDCCGMMPNDTVFLYVAPLPTATGSGDVAICEGESALLSLAGLNPTDSVEWSPTINILPVSASSVSVDPSVTTTYTATVYSVVNTGTQSILSCPISIDFIVTVNENPAITMATTPVVCANDGTATATVTSPGTFNFAWSNGTNQNGVTSSSITNLSYGMYAVTVTNAVTGCISEDSIEVVPSPGVPIVYIQTSQGACEGTTDGFATANTAGGTAPYNYTWNTGSTGATLTNLAAGTYSVTVVDANGCSSTVSVTIPEYHMPDLEVYTNGPVCYGDSGLVSLIGHDGATLVYSVNGVDTTLLFTEDTMYLTFYNVQADIIFYFDSIYTGECSNVLAMPDTLSLYPVPTVTIAQNGPICEGDDAIFTLTGVPDAVVNYTLDGVSNQNITLVGGTATITVPAPTLDQVLLLDSISDINCVHVLTQGDTIIVYPVSDTIEFVNVCENTNYTYPDGVSELIVANTSHLSTLTTVNGCDSLVTTNIIMDPVFASTVAVNVCENTYYTFPDGFADTITTDISHTSNLLSSKGCDSTIVTNVTMMPIYSFSVDTTICAGEDITFPDGVTHTSIQVDEVYTSQFTTAAGCDSLIVTNVTVNPLPTVDVGQDTSLCDGESIALTATTSPGSALVWDNGVTDGATFTPTTTMTYTATVTSPEGCIAMDAITVTVNPNPVALFSADVLEGCEPLEVTFTNLSTGSPILCEWNFGDGSTLVNCGTVSHTYLQFGLQTVSLTVTDGNGCSSFIEYQDYIDVYEMPIAGFTASTYELDILHGDVAFTNTSVDATNYQWYFGDSTASTLEHPSHTYPTEQPANYLVTLIAINGPCMDTAYAKIIVNDVLIYYVPNTFSPDGDEFNNVFRPVFTSGFDPYDFHMVIYNRWGETVFESYDAVEGWDGTYNGKNVQDGTYTWTMDFQESMSDKRHSANGHVNVIR